MVNTAVYGDSQNWIDYNNSDALFLANFGEYDSSIEQNSESTLGTANINEKLLINTFDDSITAVITEGEFWGKYLSFIKSNFDVDTFIQNNPANYQRLCFTLWNPPNTFEWSYNSEISGRVYNNYGWLGSENNVCEVIDKKFNNIDGYCKPIVKYNTKNTRWLLIIRCRSSDNTSNSQTICLEDYINHYYETYPLIEDITLLPFIRTPNGWSPIGSSTTALDEYCTYFLPDNKSLIPFFDSTLGKVEEEKTVFTLHTGGLKSFRYNYDNGMKYLLQYANQCWIFKGMKQNFTTSSSPHRTRYFIGKIEKLPTSTEWETTGNITARRLSNSFELYFDSRTLTKDEFREFCHKQAAFLGVFFCDFYHSSDSKSLTKINDDSEFLYLGTIEDDGITRGNYTKGKANLTNPSYTNDIISDIKKEYPVEIVEKDSGDIISNTKWFRYKSGTTLFELTLDDFDDFFDFINTIYRPNTEELTTDFKGKNPIDYITNVLIYPFDLPQTIYGDILEKEPLTIGGIKVVKQSGETQSDILVNRIYDQQLLYSFGEIEIKRKFKNFRDFEPFTKAVIQLPFICNYEIDLKNFYGSTLKVEYVIDLMTGVCTAYIYKNGLIIDSRDGEIGYSIALSGIAQGELQNAIKRARFNVNSSSYSLFNSFNNIKYGANGVINYMQNVENYLQSKYELEHTAPKNTILSTADSLNSFYNDSRARLIFFHATELPFSKDVYGKTVGFSCLKTGKLSEFNGYTVCNSVKLDNISATAEEKEMIQQMLLVGVYN
jgi:hypothetical protein